MAETYTYTSMPSTYGEAEIFDYHYQILHLTGGKKSDISEPDMDDLCKYAPSDEVVSKYLSPLPTRRLKIIFRQQIRQAIEGYWNLENIVKSYGVFSPSYLQALKEYRQKNSNKEHTSLLVGAQSHDTVREYTATVNSIFPYSNRFVIDIANGTPEMTDADLVTFLLKDVRNPNDMKSLGSGTIDTIHTNVLFNYLWPFDSYSMSETRIQTFRNMLDLLKPGGMCMMIEAIENMDKEDLRPQFTAEMDIAGFRNIQMRPAEAFINRRDVGRFMKGTAPIITNGTTVQCRDIDLITAYKL